METKIQESQYGLVVSSRDVAEQLGKLHKNVVRDLESILTSSNLSSSILTKPNMASLIIPSTYKDKKGEERKEYLLTKDGFTLYMFNIRGYNDFKIAYIQKFNEMERLIQSQEFNSSNKKLFDRIQELEEQLNQMPMSWSQLEVVKEQIDETSIRRMKSLGIPNRSVKLRLKKELEKDIYLRCGVNSLIELKSKDYLTLMPYIFNWIEPYRVRLENLRLLGSNFRLIK